MNKLVSTTSLLLLLGAGTLSSQTQAAATLVRSADFINAFGVNLHVSQGSSNYAKVPMVLSNMNYLGIVHARDSYNSFWGNPPYNFYTNLAKGGVKWNFISAVGGTRSPTTIATFLTNISTVEKAVPGSTVAVEGPNEINNFPLVWQPDGTKGLPAALSFQAELYKQTKAHPLFKNAEVYYFTGYNAGGIPKGPDPAVTKGLADFNNQHPYPAAGKPPTKYVKRSVLGNTPAGVGPAVYTETGYQSPKTTAQAGASWLLSILANSGYNQIHRTYIYQLMDEGDGYGLFTKADNSPTPAAVAWHNFNTILKDTSSTAATFTPTKLLPFSTVGLPTTGRFLAVQKSNYETNILVWAEPDSFPGPSAPVTVNLGSTQATVNVYDPLVGPEPVQSLRNVSKVLVNLTDHPLIIQIPASTASLKKAKLM